MQFLERQSVVSQQLQSLCNLIYYRLKFVMYLKCQHEHILENMTGKGSKPLCRCICQV